MAFYPEGKPVPTEWRTNDLWLRVLRPDVTELDYDALMESRVRLRRWSSSSWPADDFTLEKNREDLIGHEREWENREAFAYTVLNPDGSQCEGCVYMYGLGSWLHHVKFEREGDGDQLPDETPVVTFWVRDSALERRLDQQLLTGLREWFKQEWPYQEIAFLITDNLPDDVALVESAGLVRRATRASLKSALRCHVYTEPVADGRRSG
jgi:hypothetical protein